MKRIAILCATLALAIGANAQVNKHSNYIGLGFGGGMNTMLYSPADGSRSLGWGYMAELKYIHFFGSHIGIGFGAQFDMTHARAKYDFSDTTFGLTHPANGLSYNQIALFNSWKERQRLAVLSIPIELYYRNTINNRWSYMIGVGAALDMPLFGNYSASEGSYELQGQFPAYGSYAVSNLPAYGFRTYDADVDADIELGKLGVSVVAEVGFNYALGNHWGLNFGLYAGYGITNLLDSASTSPIVQINESDATQIDYAGTFNSNQIDALHLLNVGVKVGLNLGWSCHHGDKAATAAAATAAAAGTAAALTHYDSDKPATTTTTTDKPATTTTTTTDKPATTATTTTDKPATTTTTTDKPATTTTTVSGTPSGYAFGNDAADDEAEAAAREARCNARLMNNPDMAQALSNIDGDLDQADQMAAESGNEEAKEAVADARAKAGDAKNLYNKGKYCKAYDLFNEAYGDIANSYAYDAHSFADNSGKERAGEAAQSADLYAEAAHRDGLDCAMAASRNARLNADIARNADNTARVMASLNDPAVAAGMANEALEMAKQSGSKPATTDAKDASGKAYRGNAADAYAAAAKSFAESASAFAAKCGKPEHKAAADEAARYADEAATAARMGDVTAAYRAAQKAKEAAQRAAACEGLYADNGTTDPAAAAQIDQLLAKIKATVYFGFNATHPDITNDVDLTLRAVSKAMAANKGIRLLITGHTDNVGSAQGNINLGRQRAEAVKQLMVGMGAPAANISTASKGQSEPVADNDTEDNRYYNRRAVITVK